MTTINFFRGHPTETLLPNKTVIEATTLLLTGTRDYDRDNEERHPLTYGSDRGALWVREEIAKLHQQVFGENCGTTADTINLTAGASYGVMNILAQTTLAHTGYTRQAFIVTPTYYLINETFLDAGFGGRLTAIDEVPGGVNLELLEERLEHFTQADEDNHDEDLKLITKPGGPEKKIYRFVMYCIPSFSNPGGQLYTLDTRLKLVELARKYDMLIITDDVYDLLDYTQPLDKLPDLSGTPRLTHLDRATASAADKYGHTVSNATLSKLIAPGLRMGYQETVTGALAHQLCQGGANVSGGSPSQLSAMVVGTILQTPGSFANVVNGFRRVYAERAQVMKRAIEDKLPAGTSASGFNGGYFIWVTFPDNVDIKDALQRIKEKGVIMAGGENFEVAGDLRDWGAHSIRLSISYLTAEEIVQGIAVLADELKLMY